MPKYFKQNPSRPNRQTLQSQKVQIKVEKSRARDKASFEQKKAKAIMNAQIISDLDRNLMSLLFGLFMVNIEPLKTRLDAASTTLSIYEDKLYEIVHHHTVSFGDFLGDEVNKDLLESLHEKAFILSKLSLITDFAAQTETSNCESLQTWGWSSKSNNMLREDDVKLAMLESPRSASSLTRGF